VRSDAFAPVGYDAFAPVGPPAPKRRTPRMLAAFSVEGLEVQGLNALYFSAQAGKTSISHGSSDRKGSPTPFSV